MSVPTTTRAWIVDSFQKNSFIGMKLVENVAIPKLGDHDVLVRIEAVSLNYRDLTIPQGLYNFPLKPRVVPASDGAGRVLAVGAKVTEFTTGDRVCTLFNPGHQVNPITPAALGSTLGSSADGTLREYAVFPSHGLILAPTSLSALEASTLTVAPLTVWNAFYGLQSKAIKPGDWVLTQGTGGVSLAGIQLAVAAGATVVATTSSEQKAAVLKKLGASHVINYRVTPNWGEVARALTPKSYGFDHIIEVGGPGTLAQSVKAIKLEGVINLIGAVASPEGNGEPPSLSTLATSFCTVRSLLVGSKRQFEELNQAIDSAKIRPVLDPKIFSFDDVVAAYEYQWARKHVGKVVVQL